MRKKVSEEVGEVLEDAVVGGSSRTLDPSERKRGYLKGVVVVGVGVGLFLRRRWESFERLRCSSGDGGHP